MNGSKHSDRGVPDVMSLEECAEYLRVSVAWLRKAVKRGVAPDHAAINGVVTLFRKGDVAAWLEKMVRAQREKDRKRGEKHGHQDRHADSAA